jgi:hypothetical protein
VSQRPPARARPDCARHAAPPPTAAARPPARPPTSSSARPPTSYPRPPAHHLLLARRLPPPPAGADFSGLWLGAARAGVGAGGAWAFVGEDKRILVAAPGGLWMALGAAESSAEGNSCAEAPAPGNASAAAAEFEYAVAWRQLNLELFEVDGGALPPAARHGPRPPAEAGRVGLVAWAPAGGGRDAHRVPPPGNVTAAATAEAPVGCGTAAAAAPKGAAEALAAVTQLSSEDLAALPVFSTSGAPPQPRGFFAAASGGRAAALVASAQGAAAASSLGFPGAGAAAPVEASPPEDLTVEFRNYLSHECVGFGALAGGCGVVGGGWNCSR